ncbi:MAG TPA: glycosyltransferase family 9 protein, partial [Candidatus Acidoferrales bacterium]|nr:glycosyltransferase family 9 protein [Candidatus Acidoferrales bacterium]
RFLVVRLTALGDILHTVPAVAALRAAPRNARIDWVVERKWAPVLEGSPALNEVIPFDRRSLWGAVECVQRLRENRYTCAIDFQGLYKSSVLAGLSGAPRRIGFDRRWAREEGAAMFYTEHVIPAGRHVAELNYSLAVQAGASRTAAPEYPLRVPAGGAASVRARLHDLGITGEYMVVGPGGSWRAKLWPAERYGELSRELAKRSDVRIVVIHGPGEKPSAEELVRAAAPARPTILATTIEELMGLLAHARCLIAADSGPLHLAAALGTPVVGLYGPTDPARNGPFAPGAIVVHKAQPEEISYKRRAEYSSAMLRITVDDVLAAAEPLLKAAA